MAIKETARYSVEICELFLNHVPSYLCSSGGAGEGDPRC